MQTIYIHPDNPQPRLIAQLAQALKDDKLVVYAGSSGYQFAFGLQAKDALAQLERITQMNDKLRYTLLCQDLSQISAYADLGNVQHRIIKSNLNKQIDFVLMATKNTPKKLQHKDKTIAIRGAGTPIEQAILQSLQEPIAISPIIKDGEFLHFDGAYEVEIAMDNLVDLFINSAELGTSIITMVDISQDTPSLIQQGDENIDHIIA